MTTTRDAKLDEIARRMYQSSDAYLDGEISYQAHAAELVLIGEELTNLNTTWGALDRRISELANAAVRTAAQEG